MDDVLVFGRDQPEHGGSFEYFVFVFALLISTSPLNMSLGSICIQQILCQEHLCKHQETKLKRNWQNLQ